MSSYRLVGGSMDEAEAAAAIAAVTCILEAEAAAEPEAATVSGWASTARLTAQGLLPTRLPVTPRWNTIERLRRAGRSAIGIVGQ